MRCLDLMFLGLVGSKCLVLSLVYIYYKLCCDWRNAFAIRCNGNSYVVKISKIRSSARSCFLDRSFSFGYLGCVDGQGWCRICSKPIFSNMLQRVRKMVAVKKHEWLLSSVIFTSSAPKKNPDFHLWGSLSLPPLGSIGFQLKSFGGDGRDENHMFFVVLVLKVVVAMFKKLPGMVSIVILGDSDCRYSRFVIAFPQETLPFLLVDL